LSAASLASSSLTLKDGAVLLAPGGAFLPEVDTLVIADAHAGLLAELRARGYALPEGDDGLLYRRVRAMIERTRARHVVVAGDLVHGPRAAIRPRGALSPMESFVRALAPCVVRVVRGNHDRSIIGALDALGIEHDTALRAGRHAITHGDDVAQVRALRDEVARDQGRVLVGHVHPALTLDDGAGARRVCPAFVSARALLCLPAISVWARGGDVRSRPVRAAIDALTEGERAGVAVVVGERVLPIGELHAREFK
jgi:putative SbcD/Mre11-related phosphoesterase